MQPLGNLMKAKAPFHRGEMPRKPKTCNGTYGFREIMCSWEAHPSADRKLRHTDVQDVTRA